MSLLAHPHAVCVSLFQWLICQEWFRHNPAYSQNGFFQLFFGTRTGKLKDYITLCFKKLLIFCFNTLFSSYYFSLFAICLEGVSGYLEWKPLKGDILRRPLMAEPCWLHTQWKWACLCEGARASSSATDFWITYIGIGKQQRNNTIIKVLEEINIFGTLTSLVALTVIQEKRKEID